MMVVVVVLLPGMQGDAYIMHAGVLELSLRAAAAAFSHVPVV